MHESFPWAIGVILLSVCLIIAETELVQGTHAGKRPKQSESHRWAWLFLRR